MNDANLLPGKGSHLIPLHYAIQLTSRYRNNKELITDLYYKGQDILPFSEIFNKVDVELLLAQPEAAGLRTYYGMDDGFSIQAILVAVDRNNEDILGKRGAKNAADAFILWGAQRDPQHTLPPSVLNR